MTSSLRRDRTFSFRAFFGVPGLCGVITLAAVGATLVASTCLAADCNGNGEPDTADLASGQLHDRNENGTPDECELLKPHFTPTNILSLGRLFSVTPGDLNGDGLTDLIAWYGRPPASWMRRPCLILQGEGRSWSPFVPPMRGLSKSPGGAILWTGVADCNGDDLADFVLLSAEGLQICLQEEQSMRMQRRRVPLYAVQTLRPATLPDVASSGIDSGDIDGDGDADLLVGGIETRLRIYRGGAEAPFSVEESIDPAVRTAALTLADFDGDGDLDVALVQLETSVFIILDNDGTGAFESRHEVPLPKGTWLQIEAGDFDGDGSVEASVVGDVGVVVIRPGADGKWGAQSTFHFADGTLPPRAAWAVDVNQDRRLDLVVESTDRERLYFLQNDGNGRFAALAQLEAPERHALHDVADFDQDGRVDLVATTGAASTLELHWQDAANNPGLRFTTRTQSVGFEPHSSVLQDFDGDGDLDLAAIDGEWDVHVFTNDGKGKHTHKGVFSMQGANELFSLTGGDFDGDGDFDLAGVDEFGGLYTLLNDGNARFQQGQSYYVGRRPWQVMAVDLLGKGTPDLLTTNMGANTVSHLRSTGGGRFRKLPDVEVESGPAGMAAADIDGDGDLDVAVACASGGAIIILENDPPGRLTVGETIGASRPSEILAVDFDANGAVDLLVARQGGDTLSLLLQRQKSFQRPKSVFVGRPIRSLRACDLDADGHADVVTASERSNTVSALLGNGDGTFAEPTHLRAGYDPRFTVTGDIDADGDEDIIAANHSSYDLTIARFETPPPPPPAYATAVVCEADLHRLGVAGAAESEVVRSIKFFAPARQEDEGLLPLMYQNSNQHALHQEFLAQVFPDRFPALPQATYDRLTARRETRDYFAGRIDQVAVTGGRAFRFELASASLDDPAEAPSLSEVRSVYNELHASFHLGPLVYRPSSGPAREVAATWTDPGFPVEVETLEPQFEFVAYTTGVAYGHVRLLSSAEFSALNEQGGITFRDILVLEHAPREVNAVFGGIITEDAQGELSHIAVRTARRGTPNAYLRDAREVLADWSGRLVRLEVNADGRSIREATLEEATSWWNSNRPRLSILPEIDASTRELPSLLDLDLSAVSAPPEARYGGKATHMARLQRVLDGEWRRYREVGFAIPVAWFLEFMKINSLASAREPTRTVSYAEFVRELEDWETFQADAALRVRVLAALRSHMELEGRIPSGLLDRLRERLRTVFGSERTVVRFRSSSNVEDALEFNGAGLYDSTSACIVDDFDGDDLGPCACDAERLEERTVERALKRVWSSLWNIRAHEERDYYGIPFSSSAMAILVTRAFGVEHANGVAFTGNPSRAGDGRYVVSVQDGETSVVSPEPGVLPEKNLLEIEGGEVSTIVRAQASSLAPPTGVVLSDDRLRELGALLAHLDANLPIDRGGRRREDVLLDVEFKITRDDDLAVKQVRPFLRTDAAPPLPVFELEVPEPLTLCGAFVQSRPAAEALANRCWVRLTAGRYRLPSGQLSVAARLVETGRFGPEQALCEVSSDGVFRVRSHEEDDRTIYTYRYDQSLELADGRQLKVTIPALRFVVEKGRALNSVLRLDEATVESGLKIEGRLDRLIHFSSCGREALPLWRIETRSEDGLALEIFKRFRPPRTRAETGPADLVRATIEAAGRRQTVSSYWDLIYTAGRHNRSEIYWLVLPMPMRLDGLEEEVRALEVVAPEPRYSVEPEVRYLGRSFQVLRETRIESWQKDPVRGLYREGDVDGDDRCTIADAHALAALFFGGLDGEICQRAGDHDLDGDLDLVDFLAGVQRALNLRAVESGACRLDRGEEGLSCPATRACGRVLE